MRRTMSLEVMLGYTVPSTRMRKCWDLTWLRVEVASTSCSTYAVPKPKVITSKAPCMVMWLFLYTHSVPERVKPCSGLMMCTMHYRSTAMPKYLIPTATLEEEGETEKPR